jgi:hypothetical protein
LRTSSAAASGGFDAVLDGRDPGDLLAVDLERSFHAVVDALTERARR